MRGALSSRHPLAPATTPFHDLFGKSMTKLSSAVAKHLGRGGHGKSRRPSVLALALCLGLVGEFLTGCVESPLAPVIPSQAGDVELAVIELDWHTEIGISLDQISGPLATAVPSTTRDKYLVAGFGDRAYFTDQDAGAGTALAALFSGPSAVQLAVFETLPEDDSRVIVKLRLPRQGLDQIVRFIWNSLDKSDDGGLRQVAQNSPRSVFFAGRQRYAALYNCNSWTAEALKTGGLPFDPGAIVFASQVMASARQISSLQAPSNAVARTEP
jgi:hypothetical protein